MIERCFQICLGDRKSLFRYLNLVWMRARFPDYVNWRIGACAKLSSTYSGRLKWKKPAEPTVQVSDREALKILTSRGLSRGRMIAENAARGRFPSYDSCPHALKFDLTTLFKKIDTRWKIQERLAAKGK